MSAPTTTHTQLDTATGPTPVEILSPQSTTPATTVSTEDGWEVEDVGRVRGTNLDSVVQAEQQMAQAADGADPTVLGDPDLPEPDISDDTDRPASKPQPQQAKPATEKRGKLKLSQRVEELKGRVSEETRLRRELERGNLTIAREILARAEGRSVDRGEDRPAPRVDDRPRREDGTFAARRTQDPEPKVPERPKRPSWDAYEKEDKSWAEFNKDVAAYEEQLEAYLDAKTDHKAWKVRQDLGGEIARRDQQMREISEATARERVDAAFAARKHAVVQEYGPERWKTIQENWQEYDDQGYRSDFIETLVQFHDQGPRVMAALGEQIEKAALLADRQWTKPMFDGMMALEDPVPVLLALADDPEAFERIAQYPPSRAVAAIGALSGRLAAGVRAHGSRPAPISKAPAPTRPVGGRREGGTTGDSGSVFDPDVPLEDYISRRNAGERR